MHLRPITKTALPMPSGCGIWTEAASSCDRPAW